MMPNQLSHNGQGMRGHILIDVHQKTVEPWLLLFLSIQVQGLLFSSKSNPLLRTLNYNLPNSYNTTHASEVFFEHEKDE